MPNTQIATIVFSRYNRLKFDPLWLDDLKERVIIDKTVEEINPLVTNPGRLLLSTKYIYFQPYNNILPVGSANFKAYIKCVLAACLIVCF